MEEFWIKFGRKMEFGKKVEKCAEQCHAQDLSLGPASPLKEENLRPLLLLLLLQILQLLHWIKHALCAGARWKIYI